MPVSSSALSLPCPSARFSPDLLRLRWRAWKLRLRDGPGEISAVRQFVRPGTMAIDAGAYKGAFSWWMVAAAGPAGAVWAYEPQPGRARALASWFGPRLVVRPVALSSAPGRAFLTPGGGPDTRLTGTPGGPAVPVTTLDADLRTTLPVSFLKIDAEGHEAAILAGARDILTRHRPVLLVECEARHQSAGQCISGLFTALLTSGYSAFFFHRGRRHPLAAFDPQRHQPTGPGRYWDQPGYVNNFLFVPSVL